MQQFQFHVTDDRATEPSVMLVQTRDPETARAMAERLLENHHYRAVEVWKDDDRLFVVDEPVARPPRPRRSGWAYRERFAATASRPAS